MARGRRRVGGELLALGAMTAASGVALMLARDLRGRGTLHDEWTVVGGRRMFARAGGSFEGTTAAVPVVLVHGYGMSSRYMIPTAVRLLPQFVVYAPDLPGHGRSENHGHPLRVEQLADALVEWMDATGIPCASLVGHSFGCQVVANAAARYHTRVDRIVLVAPVADPRAATISQQFRRLLVSSLAERATLGLLLALDYTLAGPHILVDELRELVGYRIADDLRRITAPSMVVRGTRDSIVPERWARRVATLLHAERYAAVPNGGHALNYSAPRALVDAVRPFLTEARTTQGRDRLPLPADAQ
jgi:2-hydroxy-6-oxonona-2,4-dienedioate hydrolase